MANRSKKDKLIMFEKQGGLCYWCKRPMVFSSGQNMLSNDSVTIDHIYPVTDPRRIHYKNIKKQSPVVLACHECNQKRKDTRVEKQEKDYNINPKMWRYRK